MSLGPNVTDATTFLTAIRTGFTWVKLHLGDPGVGASSPAVLTTRQQATWSALATVSNVLGFDNVGAITWTAVPATEDPTHFSLWSAASGGTFGGSGIITAPGMTIGGNYVIPAGALDVSLPVAGT